MSRIKLHGSLWLYVLGALLLIIIVFSVSSHNTSPETLFSYASSRLKTDEDKVSSKPHSKTGLVSNILEQTQNATLGFEKIFVINLPLRTDHKDAITLAASVTGLEVDFIDGVTKVDRKTLPPGKTEFKDAELGNWRAHLNAAWTIVDQGISSALILEDDADWDLRIKSQMRDYAKAVRLLVQPQTGTNDSYLDPTFPNGNPSAGAPVDLQVGRESVSDSIDSPYGDLDRWDMLWIGHCGTRAPGVDHSTYLSTGRAVILDDETVPERQHVRIEFGDNMLVDKFPDHTRVVHRAHDMLCTLGYALSLQGARRLLHQASLVHMMGQTDLALGAYCDGNQDNNLPVHMCFTVQPQLFNHHRPVGKKSSFSDISDHDGAMNEQAFSRNIRWSTRLNLLKLINGEKDYIDLFKDGEKSPNYGWRKR